MLPRSASIAVTVLVTVMAVSAAPDISGKWTATFNTQIGEQTYTYDFVVKGSTLTGKAKSNIGQARIVDGRIDGNTVTFVELLDFDGTDLRIEYRGTIVSADEIKFTRKVADTATEELVARRAK
jgi:hypothetical protein